MQRKNYDSEFCGNVPLNYINHIQPYGGLIVVAKEDLHIIQVSQNVDTLLGLNAEDVVDTPLEKYVPKAQIENLTTKFTGTIDKLPLQFDFNVDGKETHVLTIAHSAESYYLLELEPTDKQHEDNSFVSVYQEIKYATVAINAATSLEEVCQTTIRELKRISGFDKIMVYKFDEQWNGLVIAEIMEEGMEPYLGLRFPASDIPRQARQLYLTNPYRLIPDCEYTPVKLYPVINSATQTFTDLSGCNVRGVPAVHTEYLRNMKVRSSMSTRIIKDDKLWGLIACHHRTPKFLSYELCSVFELLSGIASARFSSLQNTEDFTYAAKLQDVHTQLVEQLYAGNNLVESIISGDTTILNLLNIEGAVVTYQKRMESIGNVPDRNTIKNIIIWLQTNNINKLFHTTELADIYEEGINFSGIASGMIVLPIHAQKGEYIIGFRPEAVQKVNWGGNPDEAIQFEEDKKNYHPRNSFKLWQQTVQHNSLPWQKQELEIAEDFRNALVEFTLKKVYT